MTWIETIRISLSRGNLGIEDLGALKTLESDIALALARELKKHGLVDHTV